MCSILFSRLVYRGLVGPGELKDVKHHDKVETVPTLFRKHSFDNSNTYSKKESQPHGPSNQVIQEAKV
jgi:hypothetical protein